MRFPRRSSSLDIFSAFGLFFAKAKPCCRRKDSEEGAKRENEKTGRFFTPRSADRLCGRRDHYDDRRSEFDNRNFEYAASVQYDQPCWCDSELPHAFGETKPDDVDAFHST